MTRQSEDVSYNVTLRLEQDYDSVADGKEHLIEALVYNYLLDIDETARYSDFSISRGILLFIDFFIIIFIIFISFIISYCTVCRIILYYYCAFYYCIVLWNIFCFSRGKALPGQASNLLLACCMPFLIDRFSIRCVLYEGLPCKPHHVLSSSYEKAMFMLKLYMYH